MPQYGNMVCQKLQSAILLLFFPFTLQEKFCITYNCTCVGNRDCQNFSCWFDPFSPIMSLWSSVFVRLWAASFITWPSKLLLLVFPILWCKSQTEADIFLCCQLSFPINIRACLKVKNKAMFELSNHKRHLKNVWACEKHPLLYALLALKCLDGIWAENKHEESQNKWFLFSARSAWNQCILDQCNALLSDSQGASFHGDSPLRVPLRNALRMGECSSQNKGGVQGKHFLGSEIYMHGPIAESDSLNPHSGFSQRDVQFSLTQLQNIELFFCGSFSESVRLEFALHVATFITLRQVT